MLPIQFIMLTTLRCLDLEIWQMYTYRLNTLHLAHACGVINAHSQPDNSYNHTAST